MDCQNYYSNLERALFHVLINVDAIFEQKKSCLSRQDKPIYYHSPGHRGQQKGVRQALRNL